ncbi:MAG: tetratricopeptide repeat protein [Xenococcaceae cyanobacterium MO_188.B19]|nr:tetratricopeptide repeat protein [Xenococcaceae cyanobacterium MO_188.B19]
MINLSATAQSNPSNSLETPLEDPLIPPPNIQRDLSAFEIRRIEQEIVRINQQATTELNLGNQELAFQLWFREIKLQRALGRKSEVIALGRIGNIAWEQNRGTELREIAQRLIAIEEAAATEDNFNNDFLDAIALSYQQIKYLDRAVSIYQITLQEARQQNDLVREKNNLEQLGKLYFARFDYLSAASIYEELLTLVKNDLATKENDPLLEPYLINLVEIYHYLNEPESAIRNQQQLIDQYLTEGKISAIPRLKIAVGNNYQNLQQSQLASQYYQEAYTLAQSLRQVAVAADALTELGRLYQQNNQPELAIAIYLQLINLEQKSNNFYGLINAYDNLGNLYLAIEAYPQALASFEAGLAVAESLDYRTNYFVDKIQQLQ